MQSKVNPYVGPRPFEPGENDRFFGRIRESRDLYALVLANNTTLLYAPSGAGKTSLLNASLIPTLSNRLDVLPPVRVFRALRQGVDPERIPNRFVFNVLAAWTDAEPVDAIVTCRLAEYLGRLRRTADARGKTLPRAIIVDQLEELFTTHQDRWQDRKDFFQQVGQALEEDPLLKIIFSIRQDFLAQLEPYQHLLPGSLRTRLQLDLLRKGEAKEAITGPLEKTDRRFDVDAVEGLLDDLMRIQTTNDNGEAMPVCGEFVEPVQLQVVCQSLWESLPAEVKVISKELLADFADVGRTLVRFYDEAISATARDKGVRESKLRQWVETSLITTGATRGFVWMGEERTNGLKNSVVEALEKKHIIRAEIRAGGRWYELTHDRFIEPVLASGEHRRARVQRRRMFLVVALCGLTLLSAAITLWKYHQQNVRVRYLNAMYGPKKSSSALLYAWEALTQLNYPRAIQMATSCVESLRQQADVEQQRLVDGKSPPPPVGAVTESEAGAIVARGALNTTAECYLVKGDAAERLHLHQDAMTAWYDAAKYTFARSWNPRGFYWSPARAAMERLKPAANRDVP